MRFRYVDRSGLWHCCDGWGEIDRPLMYDPLGSPQTVLFILLSWVDRSPGRILTQGEGGTAKWRRPSNLSTSKQHASRCCPRSCQSWKHMKLAPYFPGPSPPTLYACIIDLVCGGVHNASSPSRGRMTRTFGFPTPSQDPVSLA